MTQWMHVTRTAWVTDIGIDAATNQMVNFLGTGAEVQIVPPARRTGGGDEEAVAPLARRLRLVRERRPVVYLVHPEESQMRAITEGAYDYADRAALIQWSDNRLLRSWFDAQGAIDLAVPASVAVATSPVVVQALRSIAMSRNPSSGINHGYGKDYAVDAMRKLVASGYRVNESGLERAAFEAGLTWDEVAQLRLYADGVAAGHRFVTKQSGYRADIVSLWERDAAS